jgi:hypothetical protein
VNEERYIDTFVVLGMWEEGNSPRNGETTVGIFFTTML